MRLKSWVSNRRRVVDPLESALSRSWAVRIQSRGHSGRRRMSKARTVGTESEPQPRPEPNEDRFLASLGRRVTAGLADAAMMWPACLIGAAAMAVVRPILPGMTTIEVYAVSCPFIAIPILFVLAGWWKGVGRQTIGQRLVGISCVGMDSRGPSNWLQATAHAVLAVPIAPVMVVRLVCEILSGQNRQQSMWHDRILGMAVVDNFAWKEYLAGHCRKCGYDLRGSLQSERCPECGWPIDMDAVARDLETKW